MRRPTATVFPTTDGKTIELATAFPVAGTKPTRPRGITAEAVWVGIGAGADFLGRDVKGKAVIIYSTFVPGGRSHSASDRAGLFNANTRAVALGAAAVVNVMAVPGNGPFQPEGGLREVPQFTLSQDEGFALRDRLDNGEKVVMSFTLDVPPVRNLQTEYTIATLPGASDEQIVVMTHTDGYLTPTNALGAFRWNALGSPQFERMIFDTLREFGVSVYAQEDGPKNGNYAPSFHIIDHVIYHTSLDTPELVPASGLERTTRAFVAALDRANTMTMKELRGTGFPPARGQGTLTGTQSKTN